MRFHLQLFPLKFSDWVIVLLVLFLPAALTACVLHNPAWLVVVPLGIIVLAFFIAALPTKRKVTPEQFADELERHLFGTGGPWDWDDTISVAIADPRLEEVRSRLGPNLDSLPHEKDKDDAPRSQLSTGITGGRGMQGAPAISMRKSMPWL